MQSLINPIIIALAASLITGLATYYFSTRGNEEKIKAAATEVVKTHLQINHKDSIYDYVEVELTKHKNGCGVEFKNSIDSIQNKLHHMEMKQVKETIMMSSIAKTLNKIADKMSIPTTIDTDILDVGGN